MNAARAALEPGARAAPPASRAGRGFKRPLARPSRMSRITRIELFHAEVPLPAPFRPAWIPGYPQTANSFTLLRLTTGDGRVGHAAGPAFAREREGLGDVLGPYLLGVDHADLATVHQRATELSFLGWRNFWIEAAFWDLVGQERGEPLWRLWGGASPELPVYCSTGERRSPEDAARRALAIVGEGFDAMKLRVHADTVAEDLAVVRAVREAVGPGVTIGVDANQAWRVSLVAPAPQWDLARATAFARAAEAFDVAWLEEPLDMHAFDDLAALRERTRLPIAGGELNGGWHDLAPALEKGAYAIYQPDACVSGVEDARRVALACRERGLAFTPHTWTNGVGLLVNAHLHAAYGTAGKRLEYPLDPPGWTVEARDGLLRAPLRADKGMIRLPDRPGLGVEVDERALARHATRFYDATPGKVAWSVLRKKGLLETLRIARAKRASRPGA